MKEHYDVAALGELLIDFTEYGKSAQGNSVFEANPGGAPCNVLSMLSRLGYKTAFIGKVGQDFFGQQLKETLKNQGIDERNVVFNGEVHTTLAMVHTLEDGDRDFSFYRNPGADMMLKKEEIQIDILKNARIFHFGTLSMTHPEVREATKYAVEMAARYGAMISFDPNLRPPLWSSLEDAREQVCYGLSKCQILKISDNEIQWFTGEEDFDEGVKVIRSQFDIPLILVSMGKDGSRAYYEGMVVEEKSFLMADTIETTGAGDTFCACVLHYVLLHGLGGLTKSNIIEMLRFANGAAALVTTRKGALKVMPERKEIEELLKDQEVSSTWEFMQCCTREEEETVRMPL